MNNISVPPEHKHLLRKTWEKDPDSKRAVIKNHIQNHPNTLLNVADIATATDMTPNTANKYIKEFMAQGKVTRHHKRGDGKKYIYRWHNEALAPNQHRAPDGVVTTSLGLPTFPLTESNLRDLKDLFADWCDKTLPSGDHMGGVVIFRAWLAEQRKEVEAARKRKWEEHNNANA